MVPLNLSSLPASQTSGGSLGGNVPGCLFPCLASSSSSSLGIHLQMGHSLDTWGSLVSTGPSAHPTPRTAFTPVDLAVLLGVSLGLGYLTSLDLNRLSYK